jgi:hypothetical protein
MRSTSFVSPRWSFGELYDGTATVFSTWVGGWAGCGWVGRRTRKSESGRDVTEDGALCTAHGTSGAQGADSCCAVCTGVPTAGCHGLFALYLELIPVDQRVHHHHPAQVAVEVGEVLHVLAVHVLRGVLV